MRPERVEIFRQRGLFLDLLEGTFLPPEIIQQRLFLLGWHLEHEKKLYIVNLLNSDNKEDSVVRKINQISDGIHAFKYEDMIAIVVNIAKTNVTYFERELLILFRSFSFQCVKSKNFKEMPLLKTQYRLLRGVINDLKKNSLVDFTEVTSKYIFSNINKEDTYWLVDEAIHVLSEYDSINGTEFLDTLALFLCENCSYTKVSKMLNIHRSTLIYRINKICELTGINFEDRNLRMRLIFSFMLIDRGFL